MQQEEQLMTNDVQPYTGELRLIAQGDDDDSREILAENLGGDDLAFKMSDLARVVWPGAGDDRFVVKAPSGERRESEFVGIVLGQIPPRKFYIGAYVQGSDDYPDCSSRDGVEGEVADGWKAEADDDGRVRVIQPDGTLLDFGGDCKTCPMSEWGSIMLIKPDRQSRGQACGERRHLLFQPVGARKPIIIDAPPTALQAWRAFGLDMYDLGLRLSRTVIRLTLSAKSGETAQLVPKIVGTITPDQSSKIRALMPDMRRQEQIAAPVVDAQREAALINGAEPY